MDSVRHAVIEPNNMTNPKWSILVVSYNASAEVRDLLVDLSLLHSHPDREILVAENGTEELDAMRALAVEFGFRLIELPNPGFGAACNELAKLATGENLLLANPDLRLPTDILSDLEEQLLIPEVGSVGPSLRNEDGSEQISWNLPMGLWWEFLEAYGLQNRWRRRLMRKFKERNPKGPWHVGFATAACVAIRADVFRRVGGFDEGFFLNYEDIELGDRLRANGYINVVRPDLDAVHGNSRIQTRNLATFVFHRLQAKRRYIELHYQGWRRLVAIGLWFQQAAIRLVVGAILLKGHQRTRLPGYARALMNMW
jgi:N-acetylglucosaminyl-diphospho-decaprenol L-rhamnosyltransferase